MAAKAIIIIGSLLMVAACIGAVVSLYGMGSGEDKDSGSGVKTSNRSIQSICEPTTYKDQCVSSLNQAAPNTTDPKELIKVSFQVARRSLADAIGKSATIEQAKTDPRSAQALHLCAEVMGYAEQDLDKSLNSARKLENAADMNAFMQDIKVWMGGVVTYQDTCFDSFANCTDTEPGLKLRNFFNATRQLTSNAITLMDEAQKLVSSVNLQDLNLSRRRLLADTTAEAGQLPEWLKDAKRKILDAPSESVNATAVVAQDGSGQFKTIGEALAKNQNNEETPFVVKIKAGIYNENVTVGKTQNNVVFIGDGPTKTIITGNKNFADGNPVYNTATVGIMGDGFMAKDIGFENTAGADKRQAVAVRVVGDHAVFVNCQFDGFENTLYAVRGRQFYRDCTVKGTLDTIFGDAQAVFQNSRIVIKKPLDDQNCAIIAQSRTEARGPGAFVLQNVTIVADPQFTEIAKAKGNKAYLGRPMKPYSRMIVMQSNIGDSIDPEGWTGWAGNFGKDTSYIAEYGNTGPGSDTSKRVKWKGIQKLSVDQIQAFTPDALYKGSVWVSPTGAPYAPGLVA